MSCQNFTKTQDGILEGSGEVVRLRSSGVAYYRWKNANIEINGCDEHLLEIFAILNKAQKNV